MRLTNYSAKKEIKVTVTNVENGKLTYVHDGKSVTHEYAGVVDVALLEKATISTGGQVTGEAAAAKANPKAKTGGGAAFNKSY